MQRWTTRRVFGLALTLALIAPAAQADAIEQAADESKPQTMSRHADAPSPGTVFLYSETISLEDGTIAVVDRGTLHVPLVRSDPKSRMIGIDFYRFKASAKADPKTPPVFRLHGGPGFPGLWRSLERDGFYENSVLPRLDLADYVVVGQRGIGSSRPNTACGRIPEMPLDQKVSEDEQIAIMQGVLKECRELWEGQGYDLRGLNVVEAAADVDALRRVLGYDTITIDGGSFGSHWGMTVMRYHPEIVARAILTGMEGPDHTWDMPSWVLNSLQRLAAEAEGAEALEERIPDGGLIAAFESVVKRFDAEPVTVEVQHPETEETLAVRLDGEDIRDVSLGYSGRASSRRGARTWASDVLTLYHGDYADLAAAVADQRIGGQGLPTASFFMLDCGSGISPAREAELNADPAQAIVGDLGWFYRNACPMWGSDLGDAFRKNFTTGIPTVIVHGTWDTSTPYENAVELAPFFTNSKFVTVQGGSHGALREALGESESFREALFEFVRTGDMASVPETVDLAPLEWVVPDLEKAEASSAP